METYQLIIVLCLLIFTFGFGWFLSSKIGKNKLSEIKEQSKKIIEEAEREAKTLKKEKLLEVKDEWHKLKQNFESETKNRRIELEKSERHLVNKEINMDRKADLLNKKEKELANFENELKRFEGKIKEKEKELEKLIDEQNTQLEKIARLSSEEAKKMLIDNLIEKAKAESAQMVKDIREEAKLNANKEAREIIISAIQRTAADHSVESTVSVVSIPNDEMKGRIIGREGRNIRAFETATGIEVIVDDTPEAVVLSGFDPLRREVAKIALEKLISDGRIHPGRIEDVVKKAKQELDEMILQAAEQALLETGISKVHPELMKLIGKLKYRTSYGQNVLQHSIEVAFLSGLMAAELDLDPTIAKRAGLLHDIGKAIDKYTEGTHTTIGEELAKKYNEHKIVVNAIASHHEDVEFIHPISALVQAADAISGSRPGARRETLEGYIKRLHKLEQVATSFDGVSKTYAIQAGREVRVIVENNKVDDVASYQLAQDIASKIQSDMEYPGQIKVTVIREFRAVEYAK